MRREDQSATRGGEGDFIQGGGALEWEKGGGRLRTGKGGEAHRVDGEGVGVVESLGVPQVKVLEDLIRKG